MHFFLCDFLLDIASNSFEADATKVQILISEDEKSMAFKIEDNGRGMDEKTRKRALDPFYTDASKHPQRKVGLGLPFALQSGKSFSLESSPGKGTKVELGFDLTDIDVPPAGDLPSAILAIMTGAPEGCEVKVEREISTSKGSSSYRVSKSELKDALGELDTACSQNLAKLYLKGLEEELQPLGPVFPGVKEKSYYGKNHIGRA